MTQQSHRAAGPAALLAEAAHWQVRRQDGLTPDEEAQFQAWLAAGDGRSQAYARIDGVWQGLDALPTAALAQLSASVRRAPVAVPATAPRRTWLSALSPRSSLSWLSGWLGLTPPLSTATAVLALSVLGAGWMGWTYWQAQPVFSATFATARGEQMDVDLPDGSVLKLDTATRVEVALYRDRRQVRLPEGQVMFTVKADAAQPFDVLTDRLRVTVVGTRFSMRNTRSGLAPDGVGVQVEQGRVRVSRLEHGQPAGAALMLSAGEYVQADPAGQLAPVQARPARNAMLWRDGRVNFERTPLAQALAEFERYGATRLRISDPAVAALRVNGSFDLRQAEAFAHTLPLVLPVQLRADGAITEIGAASPLAK